nr:NADH dehydrogenase subunit 1 [Cordagalma sp.]
MEVFIYVLKIIFLILPILISVAYLTLLERKVLGYSQLRKGPNVVGIYGILQPLADGVKLFSKEILIPSNSNLFLYVFSPVLALTLSLFVWFFLPYFKINNFYNLLIILVISSITVYAIFLSGWSSNSKYAFLGAIRATAQMISYEITLSLIIIIIIINACSLNLNSIINSQKILYIIPLFNIFIMFLISSIAECNRAPFDLTEGESELVSGFNIEYSAMSFALFFLAEYGHIIFSSFIIFIVFFKAKFFFYIFFIFFFIWIRTSFPRIRYDQLMYLIWKDYLPISFSCLLFNFLLLWLLI